MTEKEFGADRKSRNLFWYGVTVLGILLFAALLHVMYGSCQTSSWHYRMQSYWMPSNLPRWMNYKETNEYGQIISPPNYTGVWNIWRDEEVNLESSVNYSNGVKSGTYKSYHYNGAIEYSGYYQNGLRVGVHEGWHDNGILSNRSVYSDGNEDGLWEAWDGEGRLFVRCNFQDGIHHGLYERWHGNGKKMESIIYDNGIIISEQHWDEDGNLIND